MPTDFSPHYHEGVIQVRDRAGVGLPFSKGLMATSILATGVETDAAYLIAKEIEDSLRRDRTTEIAADQLVELAAKVIADKLGGGVAERYRAWRMAKRCGRPVFVVLSGAPGIGKSTLATRLAVRLGITRIVTTDTIREVLRTVIPDTVLPELHLSTYETVEEPGANATRQQAFDRQSRAVGAATAAVARRLAHERRSAIVEGVHMIPGQLGSQLAGEGDSAIVIEMLLTLADEELHRAHLVCRLHDEPARGGDRHIRHFAAIRSLQDGLRRHARQASVPEYDVADPQDLTQQIVDEIVARVGAEDYDSVSFESR